MNNDNDKSNVVVDKDQLERQDDEEEGNQKEQEIQVSKTTITKIKRIMIVEDDNDLNFLFKMVLEESDYRLRVYSFIDPLIALHKFRPDLYDLVIIDIVMPGMNGIELYNNIRKLDSKVKVCFITAANEEIFYQVTKEAFPSELEDIKKCVIRKPITNEDLIKKMKEVLEIK